MMNPATIRATLVSLLLIPVVCAAQTTWHVDDDSCPNAGTGTEVDPFCSIQAGIDAAGDGQVGFLTVPGNSSSVRN